MNDANKVEVLYFSDVLCIWAYLAQVRMDELKIKFGLSIDIKDHFFPVFGSIEAKMAQNWAQKGGIAAYGDHVKQIATRFAHIEVHPDIWHKNTPSSSTSCHLFLKAIQILQSRGELNNALTDNNPHQSKFKKAVWELRLAFFKDLIDVSKWDEQMNIAQRLALPLSSIEKLIKSGQAFAALDEDLQAKQKYGITGSPSLILNEGRQKIYGNVGYRVIEANIQELLKQPDSQASWC